MPALAPTHGFAHQSGSSYSFGCDQDYSLPPNYSNQSFCQNGKWVPEIPHRCIPDRGCAAITDNSLLVSECSDNGLCDEKNEVGSTVTTTCKKGYHGRESIVHTCQQNEQWWPPVTGCEAVCGRKPLAQNVPWLAKIHRPTDPRENTDQKQVILNNGIIVSDRVVLTYGEESFYLFGDEISTFSVYAGSHIYGEADIAEETTQARKLVDRFLFRNPVYPDDQTFAVLIVDRPFDFNLNYVAPVCLDFTGSRCDADPVGLTGSLGAFVHYTYRIDHISYKIIDKSECLRKSNDTNVIKNLNSGKWCARRPQNTGGFNCAMVIGTAFVTPVVENGEHVFYLKGMASRGFQEAADLRCNEDEFQLFFNINYFKDHLQYLISRYSATGSEESVKVPGKACPISSVPKDVVYESRGFKLDVGNVIEDMDIIEYSCPNGYRLSGGSLNICVNGNWNTTHSSCEQQTTGKIQLNSNFKFR